MTGYESKKAMAQAKLDSMEREALKLALDLATMHHTDDGYAELRSKVRQFAKEALAQPAQEPVAWLQIGVGPLHEGDVLARTTKPKEWNSKWWKFEPLYTTPPQRPWVGLTEEDFSAINQSCFTKLQAATSAESILKEKNNG